jgi:Transposase DDE domain
MPNASVICPQDQVLLRHSRRQRDQVVVYRAKPSVCNMCPVKAECTASRSGRHIFRSFQDYVERVRRYHTTAAYQKALRKRMVWVEPLFAEIKQWHHLTQFRLRGLHKVNVEGLIAATGQNLKRLLNHWRRERTRTPGTIMP